MYILLYVYCISLKINLSFNISTNTRYNYV